MSDLDRVKSLLGPPADAAGDPVEVVPADWSEIHAYLGLRLPKSYTDFVDYYGYGSLGLIVFSHPSADPDSPFYGWGDLLSRIKAGDRYLRQRRELLGIPYPVHPEPGGLIRWGASSGESHFFFLADPPDEPERWPIVWHDAALDTWDEFPGPFDRFLLELVSKKLPVELVGEAFSYDIFDPHGPGALLRPDEGFDPDYVPPDD